MRRTLPRFAEGVLELDDLGFCVGALDTLECALILSNYYPVYFVGARCPGLPKML